MFGVLEWLGPVGLTGILAPLIAGGVVLLGRVRSGAQRTSDASDLYKGVIEALKSDNERSQQKIAALEASLEKAEEKEDKMRAERDAALTARDVAITMRAAAIGHVRVLEEHIYKEIGPPPPARPGGFE